MTTTSKYVVGSLIVGAIIGLFIGHSFWPSTSKHQLAGASPAGSVNGVRSMTEFLTVSPSTTAIASSTAITNNDSNDRIITSEETWCSGLTTLATPGPAQWVVFAATSTAGTTTPPVNTNFLLQTSIATTSTPLFVTSSSTPGQSGTGINRVWPAGSSIDIWFNATTSATCNFAFGYIGT